MTSVLSAGTTSTLEVRPLGQRHRGMPAAAWPYALLRVFDRGRPEAGFREAAHVENAAVGGDPTGGPREFLLWTDAERQTLLARVTTASVDGRHTRYHVCDAHGAVLATVDRSGGTAMPPRRARWLVTRADGATLHAVKGTRFGWSVWWALSPLWVLMFPVALLGGDIVRMPRATTWRHGRTPELALKTATSTRHDYTVHPGTTDPRVHLALATLHHSFPVWRDR
ncbi:MAG TPA: hypothetical protein VLH10_19905 [Yinghuangia sp.]|uniref:hypothetical protein n=1 Tax=Yinghuangia sp. YIM S10712 TaxID=3436930 RepID=UPI002B58B3CD|nr:hypothetical protein [Yinghuangia sp.]